MGKKYDEKTIELFYEIYAEELRNNEELKELLRNITVPNEIFLKEREPNPYFRFARYVLGKDSKEKTYNTENLKEDLPKMRSVTGNNHWQLNRIIGGIAAVASDKASKTKTLADEQKANIKKDLQEYFEGKKNSPKP